MTGEKFCLLCRLSGEIDAADLGFYRAGLALYIDRWPDVTDILGHDDAVEIIAHAEAFIDHAQRLDDATLIELVAPAWFELVRDCPGLMYHWPVR